MSLSPSNRYMNATAGFTPAGGSANPLGKLTDFSLSLDGEVVNFKGDLDVFATLCAVPSQSRVVEITCLDVGASLTVVQGVVGTLVVTLADAVNGIASGGGAKILTLSNAMRSKGSADGKHADAATGKLTFVSYSSNGTTDPLAITTP